MTERGWDVDEVTSLAARFHNEYYTLLVEQSYPDSSAWVALTSQEAEAAAADAARRGEAHDLLLTVIADPLAAYLDRHADDAVAVRADIDAAAGAALEDYNALMSQ